MIKTAFFTIFCLFLTFFAQAQNQVTITGTVTLQATGFPAADQWVYAYSGDSLNFSNGEAITNADGTYSIIMEVGPGISEVQVFTQFFCDPVTPPIVVAPIVNGQAVANFVICDSIPLPPFGNCWAGINVSYLDSLTFGFSADYFNIDSAAIISYYWSFGDGTSSTEATPTHTYSPLNDSLGFYLVTVTITSANGCVATTSFPINTSFPPVPECAGYITYIQTATTAFDFAAVVYDFNGDPAAQAISYLWDFGDGATSTEANPSHTYASEGVYTVQLHALTADSCEIHACDVVFAFDCSVDTFTYGCQAMFSLGWPFDTTGTPTQSSLTLSFYDASLGIPLTWAWDFGDNTTSDEQNPTHTYAEEGTYTVTLSITTLNGCESEISFEIYVGDSAPWVPEFDCQAMFLPLPGIGGNGLPFPDTTGGNGIQFIDLSYSNTPIQSWAWSFGDGSGSTEQNPYHLYTQPGIYTVSLTIAGDSCSSVISFEIDTQNPWNFSVTNTSVLGLAAGVTATQDVATFEGLKYFPNPAQSELTVAFNSKTATSYELRVSDLTGKTISTTLQRAEAGVNTNRINVSNLVPGLYLAELRTNDAVQTVKFVKQ